MVTKEMVFEGAATALATPFRDGQVDFDALGTMIEFQIEGGIDGLVICGTTGEAPTLTDEEKFKCIEFAVKKAKGRVPIIAGTGTNDTAHALRLSLKAQKLGADALLLVTPYYNKGTERGIEESFLMIADECKIPIILYNVPSRTGVDLSIGTYKRLAQHERIVAVKEASGNIDKIVGMASALSDELTIYSGNDSHAVPVMSVGGRGVISVLSNIMPCAVRDMCDFYLRGKVKESAALQLELTGLISLLFAQTNPAPIKCALELMGLCTGELRLPMSPVTDELRAKISEQLRRHNIIK